MKTTFIKTIIVSFLFFLIICPNVRSQEKTKETIILFDSIYHKFHENYFTRSDFYFSESDKQDLQKLYNSPFIKNNPVYYARVQYLDALVKYTDIVPQYEGMITLLDSAALVLTKEEYPKEYAKLLVFKAHAHIGLFSNYVEAYKYSEEIFQLLDNEDKEDAAILGSTYDYLTLLWAYFGEWENALKNVISAENAFKDGGYEKTALFVRSNAYTIRIRVDNNERLRSEIKKDIELAELQSDTTTLSYLNIVLSKSYSIKNELDSAYKYSFKALGYINNYQATKSKRKSDVLYNLGKLFYLKGDYEQSVNYFNMALPYIRQVRNLYYEGDAYHMLSDIHKHYGNSDLAYNYLKQSVLIKDSLDIMNKMGEIERVRSHTELKSYQQQLQIAEQESEIRRINSLLIIAVLIVVLLIIILTLLQINKEKKMKEMRIQQLDQQLKNEEMDNKLEKLKLEKQMEEKEREIATSQLLISEKNKMLEHLLETFKPYYKSKDISDKIWRQMKSFVSSYENKENGWERSKVHFEKVHPEFFKKLKEEHPNLTENELRLCAYIRIGMRTKDIAEMLSIDHKSVITNRYHLKKKMNLGKENSLDDFIRNI